MKLTRSQLIHAKDIQLNAVGITRTKNRGWLQEALKREFTNKEVAQFEFATREKRISADSRYVISHDPDKKILVENVPQDPTLNATWLIDKLKNLSPSDRKKVIDHFSKADSPEDFANRLFESSDRDMA